ncbi:hypothetical protein SARC_06489 [Sphaeroforma arctica JP610]|uniref:Amino acid transporter transmembrane domain-containing protein n=1 Tax=Sphaeroforma arctica JP610 TaxID=667725 RepID=A0A0L0FYZ7_9EUKA|nr:hypothetical protein SARC_06489 [Sphaeroforma arctica JP610]KNC81178.1 hypothetical protein SARC_06489 [Sphaeroforma arctica JP610]|eukprot:XP_014155080.1 hypothetical protein SARC_06489 [Sphaeroforma arctica JP610]
MSDESLNLIPRQRASSLKTHDGTPTASILNLVKTILGASLLALPNAIQAGGYLVGFILLGMSASAAVFGLDILAHCARNMEHTKSRDSTYGGIALDLVPSMGKFIDFAVAIKCFGVSISYLIIVGDLLPDVAREWGLAEYMDGLLAERHFWITVVFLFVAVPLATLKHLDSLRVWSLIGNIAALFLVFVVFISSFNTSLNPCHQDPLPVNIAEQCAAPNVPFVPTIQILKYVSIFIFGFTCHQNIFTIHNEIEDNGRQNMRYVIVSSIATTLCIYIVLLGSSLNTFGPTIDKDLLKMYPKSTLMTICRLCITLLVVTSYPLQTHPCRDNITHLLAKVFPRMDVFHSARIYYGITGAICLSGYIVAICVTDLSKVLAVVGATASTFITYILPGLFYTKLHQNDGWTTRRIGAAVLFCAGLTVMTVCLTAIFVL